MRFNNNTQPYLKVLRDNEVYPPFAHIEELVMAHEKRERPLIALFSRPMMEAALLAIIAVAVLWGSAPLPEMNKPVSSVAITRNSDAVGYLSFPRKRESTTRLQRQALDSRVRGNDNVPSDNDGKLNSDIAMSTKPAADISQNNAKQDGAPSNSSENKNTQPSLHNNSSETKSLSQNIADISIQSQEVPPVTWVAFVLGGHIMPPQGASMQSFGATAGIRYNIARSSSLILEVRKNSFIVSKTTSKTKYTDSTFSLDGQSYHDFIGTTSMPVVNSSISVASLDIGYRFELMPESALSPFAEVLGGACTSGALSSEVVGIRYEFATPFLFDIDVRADQMFSSGAAPQKAFGFEAGVGFAW